MSANFNGSGNTLAPGLVDLRASEWAIGCWVLHSAADNASAPSGHIWELGAAGASYSATLTANDHVTLYDPGSGFSPSTDQNRLILSGKDQAGNWIGTSTMSLAGTTVQGIKATAYPTNSGNRALIVAQRRAGSFELWRCRPGQTAELLASSTPTWTNHSAPQGMAFGASRFGATDPYNHSVDRPFHLSGRALTSSEIERVCHGELAADIASNIAARAVVYFVSISTASGTDTRATFNPTAGTTITLNGVVITFVASGAAGNQVNIGASASSTLDNLVTFLSGSADPLLTVATYSKVTHSAGANLFGLRIVYNTTGAAGIAYTVAASSANIRVPAGGVLSYAEFDYGTLSTAGTTSPAKGSGIMTRSNLLSWGTDRGDLGEALHSDAVRVAWFDSFTVWQMDPATGTASLALTGGYSGTDPTNVMIELRDAADSSTVLAETALTGFAAAGGTWSGTLPGVPKGKRWLKLRMRKQGGADFTITETVIGIGEVLALGGQSITETLGNTAVGSVAPNGFVSRFTVADTNNLNAQGSNRRTDRWELSATAVAGGGETVLANHVSDALGCCVGLLNRSKGATSIAFFTSAPEWTGGTVSWLSAKNNMRQNGLRTFLWMHGHADLATPAATYKAAMDTLLSSARTLWGSTLAFGVVTMLNEGNSSDSSSQIGLMRATIMEWLASNSGDALVFCAGDAYDIALGGDGIHPTAIAGTGRIAERMARGLLSLRGVGNPATGARIVSATRYGSRIELEVSNAAPTLLLPAADAASGFDVLNGSTLLTVSSVYVRRNKIVLVLSADPGAEVDVHYMRFRPGKAAAGTGDASLSVPDYTVAQATPIYDGIGGTYSPGAPLRPTLTPVTTARAAIGKLTHRADNVAHRIGATMVLSTGAEVLQ